jgi:hypothetical protein
MYAKYAHCAFADECALWKSGNILYQGGMGMVLKLAKLGCGIEMLASHDSVSVDVCRIECKCEFSLKMMAYANS